MSEDSKPIKRSEQLKPLSHDHHDGLLFAWKIKQGLKKGSDLETIAKYVSWFWENHLQLHFKKEEELLVPLMPADDKLVKRMSDEHEEMEALIHINANIADETNLLSIAEKVNDHIRFEERLLFPHIESSLTQYQLDFILKKLLVDGAECSKWEEEFWK
jgi:hemerythrin-like domain-containing protein